ncbi:insulin-like growth factor-binding protein complex acid labile subunit [Littorina saxatilis]|uniref:TIR domain-containing protein n=1 Tax=Littorina saxatilis TaxID=31220 RepID=A0AAN9GN25_9CAEN
MEGSRRQSLLLAAAALLIFPAVRMEPKSPMEVDQSVSSGVSAHLNQPGRSLRHFGKGPTPSETCPTMCFCSKGGVTVNCEGKRLTTVPAGIPPSVQMLYLDHNNFATLKAGSLSDFPHLVKVFLRNSLMQTLEAGAFRNLPQLKELYLTNNNIAKLPPETFQEVNSLSLLNLGANKMTSVPDLRTLPGLTRLYLDGNQIQNATFPEGYTNLKSLNSIVMTNNNISTLTNTTFSALSNSTRRLDVARNSLKNVSPGALKPLSSLQSLKIGLNPLDGVQLKNVLLGLSQGANLASLDIRDIALGGTLPSVSFSLLANTSLTTLIFKNNRVHRIPERAFAHLPKLVQLDLSSCKVMNVSDDAFVDLPELQMLLLNNNNDLATVPQNLPSSLVKLYLQRTNLQILGKGVFSNLIHLRELYLSDCGTHEVSEESFNGLVSLRILHLQNNKLSYIPKMMFAPLTSLLTLNLKNNNLRTLKRNPGALSSLTSLTFLDMSDNQCNYIPYHYFDNLTSLQTLNLQNNVLNGLLESDRNGFLLQHMKNLRTLNLASNHLQYVHDAQFRNLNQLQHLDLKNNQLSSWGAHLFSTPGTTLQSLDLSSNQIALVHASSVHDLQHLRTLNLSLNPFACTCDLRWFRTWLNTTTVKVVNNDTYKCASPPGWNGIALTKFGPDKIDCTDYTWYYVGGAIGATFIIALIVSYILYRQRWFIRLRIYRLRRAIGRACCGRGRQTRAGYVEIEGQDDPGQKRYDFYVIAAEEDHPWVLNSLLPTLDNGSTRTDPQSRYKGKFTIYFEELDAVPCQTKIANFEKSMPASRAVLVVLTQDLNEDRWCRFLLDQAYQLKIDGEIEKVEIIKVGKVLENRVPKRLHKAMGRNEFREWPNRDTVEQDYIEHLEGVLGQGQAGVQGLGQGPGYVQEV